jgi:acyl carrier protein
MERHQIVTRLRDFIDQTLMNGQGHDLSDSTPLFDFGILDSFALFRVIGFIGEEFEVTLPLESLRTEEFESIATIADLVYAHVNATIPKA